MADKNKDDLFADDETTTTPTDPLATPEEKVERPQAQRPALQIEVVDDTPEEDKRVLEARQRRDGKKDDGDVELPPLPGNKDDLEKEIAEFGKRSQKRIRQLYERYHDERRVAEEAQRSREEAIRYAERVMQDNNNLKKTLSQGETYLIEQVKQKSKLAVEAAKKQYKEAFESGDPEKIATATEAMSSAVAEQREVERFKPRETLQPEKTGVQDGQQQPGSDRRESVQRIAPDPRAVSWAEKNKWFGTDQQMTAFAYGLHQDLVANQGVDPRSDDYYAKIDREIRKRFPEKFEASQGSEPQARQNAPRTVVAGVTRAPNSRKVTLTQTQAALAKRLGVPLEVYAQEVLKESGNA